jgi:hypothetical protein
VSVSVEQVRHPPATSLFHDTRTHTHIINLPILLPHRRGDVLSSSSFSISTAIYMRVIKGLHCLLCMCVCLLLCCCLDCLE